MSALAVPPRSRWARSMGAVLVTLAGFAWVASKVDPSEVLAALAQTELMWWVVAVLLVPLQTALAAERWHQASHLLGLPLTRRAAWTEFALSTAINQLFPGGIAGDGLRIWRQRARQHGLVSAMRAALVDRWWGQSTLAVLVLGGLLAWPDSVPRPAGLVPGVLIAVAGVATVWFIPSGVPALGRLSDDLRRTLPAGTAVLLIPSCGLLAAILAGLAACGLALGLAPGAWLLCAAPLALLAASIPVSLGGWGLREGSLVALLPLFGPSTADALALSLLFGLAFLVGALPGLVFLRAAPSEPAA